MKKKDRPLEELTMPTEENTESTVAADEAIAENSEVAENEVSSSEESGAQENAEILEGAGEKPEVSELEGSEAAVQIGGMEEAEIKTENRESDATGTEESVDGSTEASGAEGKTKKQRRFSCFPAELLAFQAFGECYLMYRLLQTDMLPGKYVITGIVILALLLLLPALLLLVRKQQASRRRITSGVVISLLIIALSAGGSYAAMRTGDTMRIVSVANKDNTVYITSEIGVYVIQENPAEKLKDLRDGKFARVTVMDQENTDKAIEQIEDKFGESLDIVEETSIEEALKDLYDDKVQALVLNTSCVNLLMESEGGEYDDLEERIRPVKTMQIKTEVELLTDNNDSAAASAEARAVTKKPFVMYLSGSDTRNMTLATSGSDVNILMFMDPINHQVLLINTPRDSYIPNPAGKGAKDKLTHCGYYGINNSIEALTDLYDIDIDYYAQINFTGFKKMIDLMGGITVYSDSSFEAEGYVFEEGEIQMDGDMALVFSRDRYHQRDGDNARGRHQMAVIKALIDKLSTDKTVLMKYPEIMNNLQGTLVTDMSTDSMTAMIRMQLNDMSSWNVQSYALIGPDGMARTYSMPGTELSVILPTKHSLNHTKDLIRMFYAGETITEEIAYID